MKRFFSLLALATVAAASGCCGAHHQQCNPCGGQGYGAGYAPTYSPSFAPSYAPSTCPGGNCGQYPSGSLTPIPQQAAIPGSTTSMAPYGTTTMAPYGATAQYGAPQYGGMAPYSSVALDYSAH